MRRNLLIGIPVVVVAIALGVAAAFGAGQLIDNTATSYGNQGVSRSTGTTNLPVVPQQNGTNNGNGRGGFGIPNVPNGNETGPGDNGGWFDNSDMGPGMMWPNTQRNGQQSDQQQSNERITIDQAIQNAKDHVSESGSDLSVAEVMEFQNNFYAVVTETNTGRGAFELLIDPYTGYVSREIGPDMMWNLKYGHMGMSLAADNTVTMEQAQADAQKALDAQVSGATLGSTEYSFYGYYTFDYQVNGKVAGFLSVNGVNGQVWLDNRLGAFISEKEVSK